MKILHNVFILYYQKLKMMTSLSISNKITQQHQEQQEIKQSDDSYIPKFDLSNRI